jgi:hypothetical protein
VSLFLEDTL